MEDENPALYDVARQVCHEVGLPWTDPRTGITHPPPRRLEPAMRKAKRMAKVRATRARMAKVTQARRKRR